MYYVGYMYVGSLFSRFSYQDAEPNEMQCVGQRSILCKYMCWALVALSRVNYLLKQVFFVKLLSAVNTRKRK